MKSYLGLILTGLISFFSIATFEIFPADQSYNSSLDTWRFIIPGIAFSLFIVLLNRRFFTLLELTGYFFLLFLFYVATIYLSMISWGLAVLIFGPAGGWLLFRLFYNESAKSIQVRFVLTGFLSGLISLVLFYLLVKIIGMGQGFGFIIAIWQFAVGYLCIRQQEIMLRSGKKQ